MLEATEGSDGWEAKQMEWAMWLLLAPAFLLVLGGLLTKLARG